jgi:hypothetical protein
VLVAEINGARVEASVAAKGDSHLCPACKGVVILKRWIKTQCLLPCAETACMLFWALLAGGQITLRRVNGWDSLHILPADLALDLAA